MIELLRKIIQLFKLTEIKDSLSYHKFKPQGLTVNILLKESHIAIHTWPEKKKCTIDLFTCSKFKWNLEFNQYMMECRDGREKTGCSCKPIKLDKLRFS